MERKNWKVGILKLIVGIFIFVGGYVNNSTISMITGVLFFLAGISLTSTKYIPMEHGLRMFMDIGVLITCIAITIYGYLLTGCLMLMIMLIFLVTLPIIMFILTKSTKY